MIFIILLDNFKWFNFIFTTLWIICTITAIIAPLVYLYSRRLLTAFAQLSLFESNALMVSVHRLMTLCTEVLRPECSFCYGLYTRSTSAFDVVRHWNFQCGGDFCGAPLLWGRGCPCSDLPSQSSLDSPCQYFETHVTPHLLYKCFLLTVVIFLENQWSRWKVVSMETR